MTLRFVRARAAQQPTPEPFNRQGEAIMVAMHDSTERMQRPNAGRITALTGAMTVNLLVLAVMLIPISIPSAPTQAREKPKPDLTVTITQRVDPTPPPPIPNPPPIPRHQRTPTPTPVTQIETPIVEQAVIAIPVSVASIVPTSEPSGPSAVSTPVESNGLSYVYNPSPHYPRIAIKKHWEGMVLLRVLVGEDGRALRVEVQKPSGHREFDNAARDKVQQEWRFAPAMRDGRAVQAWGTVPVVFELFKG
jgi:periplasmic protein TonB